ncbi:MAG: cytochrome c family protein [Calditerrivibrio sp.]|nr:cytochrome c family protein [Calditerrivibrio sp.]
MKKLAILFSIMAISVVAFANPETIDLSKSFKVDKPTKKAVVFPHKAHQAKNQCTDCHMDAKGGKDLKAANGQKLVPGEVKGVKNAIHENFCFPCHEKKQVKNGKSCTTCHK